MLFTCCVAAAVLTSTFGNPVYDLTLVDELKARLDAGESPDHVFDLYKKAFRKTYKDDVEEEQRKVAFINKVEHIRQHNLLFEKGEVSYTKGVNQFTDEAKEHRVRRQAEEGCFVSTPCTGAVFDPSQTGTIPNHWDWRDQGCVTPVKDQGTCGSCWTFGSTGSLECQVFKKTGKLVSLSAQQLLDCSDKNHGCDGGSEDLAFEYVKAVGGMESSSDYPYVAKEQSCKFDQTRIVNGSAVKGYTCIPSGDEEALKKAVATVGTISVGIDVTDNFHDYGGDVYYDETCSSTELNHAVLLVGYGTTQSGTDYWIVKNSHGDTFGDNGYIYMSRNRNNNCGIATEGLYPRVSSSSSKMSSSSSRMSSSSSRTSSSSSRINGEVMRVVALVTAAVFFMN